MPQKKPIPIGLTYAKRHPCSDFDFNVPDVLFSHGRSPTELSA